MKHIWWVPISILLLAGCVPSTTNETEVIGTEEVEMAIIPSMQLDEQYYRTLLPYKQSAVRGRIVSRIHSKYDIKESEGGLLRLSQRQFSPDDYYFQEGQKITVDDSVAWLQRNAGELAEDEEAPDGHNPLGLNSTDTRTDEERADGERPSPEILAHIVEQNYLVKTNEETIRLGGVSIGLALNSVYYNSVDGIAYEEEIPRAQLEEEGQRMADEIVSRLREREGMDNVPIMVGLFQQNSRNSISPGTYFSYGIAPGGEAVTGNWTGVNEEYTIFPNSSSEEKYREADTSFRNFKQDVEVYFSNFTSVIGTGFYQDDRIRKLQIDIPIEFYGSSEVIGFTQYLTGLVLEHFPENIEVEVSVTSTNGPEALILRKIDETEPIVHIYD